MKWKAESISFKIRYKTKMSTLTTFIQDSFESPSHNGEEKEINGIQLENKLLLFSDDMIL